MPAMRYFTERMGATAQNMTAQGDTLRNEVESNWSAVLSMASELPYSVSQSSSPSLYGYLSSMLPTLTQLIALHDNIAAQLQQAADEAQKIEQELTHIHYHGRMLPE